MNTQHDLYIENAIEKIKQMVQNNSVCLFTTLLEQLPLKTRPMSVRKVCDQGNFWFLSPSDSNKNVEIGVDERVQLFFSDTNSEYLSVFGVASILKDREKIDELWHPMAQAWLIKGIDDPNLTVIKIEPQKAFYWDSAESDMISLMQGYVTADSNKPVETGEEGKLVISNSLSGPELDVTRSC